MSSLALPLGKPAFALKLANALHVSGSTIRGELLLDYGLAIDDNVERVTVELHGTIQIRNRTDHTSEQWHVETADVVRKRTTLWRRTGGAAPARGQTVRLPFEFALPPDAPPSLAFGTAHHGAHVRYALEGAGVRAGPFARDQTVRVPLVVVPPDALGAALRPQLKLGWQDGWGRLKAEKEVRRNPWGAYGLVKMELLVPHIDSFPLFTYIPYTIVLTTFTAPMKLKGAAADAVELGEYPEAVEKDLYPPLVQDTSYLEFALRRYVDMPVAFKPSNPEEHVADIIARPHADGAAAAALLPVEAELGERIWIPDEDREGRGRWMQEATFHSRMYLRYTPSFLTEDVKVKYALQLKAEFPGQGSIVRIELPINIGSGVQSSVPLSADVSPTSPWMIDLPASYWDPMTWSDR